jgi:hypothetical protein
LPAAVLVVPLALVAAARPPAPTAQAPAVSVHPGKYWSGYGQEGGSPTSVGAVWQVPGIPKTKPESFANFWVGLGGDGARASLTHWLFGSGLEQIGVAAAAEYGQVIYYPWWEVIPGTDSQAQLASSKPHVFMHDGKPLSVEPGDFITASVTLKGHTYYMEMSDIRGTNNTIWSTPAVPASGPDLSNDSAEVIMEDSPDASGNPLPLGKFGRVLFDGAYIDGQPIKSARNLTEYTLVPNPGLGISPIGANGDNFTVTTALPAVPRITKATTYTKGELVYFNIQYADPGNDAEGFGFVGVNGSGWAKESHPFWDPSYGIVGHDSIAYPFNQGCGTAAQSSSYVKTWIFDTALKASTPVTIHLVCT